MLFYAYFSVSRKRIIRRRQNGTKSTGEVIFGRKATRWTWSARQGIRKVLTRVGGAPLGAPPASWDPRSSTDVLPAPYISSYPKTSRGHNRSGVPPPEASVATESQSRPIPAPCRRGNPSPVAIFIIPALSMTRRE